MFNLFRNKKSESIEPKQEIKQEVKEKSKKIELKTILDILQNGNEIGLNVDNQDTSEYLLRVLYLDNVEISILQWSQWHIKIKLHNNDESLTIYESPGLEVDWHNSRIQWAKSSNKNLEVDWQEEGEWCTYIEEKVETIKNRIENKRRQDQLKKQKEDELRKKEISRKKEMFNEIFKNKN